MKQAQSLLTSIIRLQLLVAYKYMDYWLPVLLFCTLPLWIIPAVLTYLSYKWLRLTKLALRKGH